MYISIGAAGLFLFILIFLMLVCCRRRRRQASLNTQTVVTSGNPLINQAAPAISLYEPPSQAHYEVPVASGMQIHGAAQQVYEIPMANGGSVVAKAWDESSYAVSQPDQPLYEIAHTQTRNQPLYELAMQIPTANYEYHDPETTA